MVPFITQKFFWRDYFDAWRLNNIDDVVRGCLQQFFPGKKIFFANSGNTAFYFTLLALKQRNQRRKIIIPAIAAPDLVWVIRKAGFIPLLCDVTLQDFNLDINCTKAIIDDDTSAVIFPYTFGIPTAIDDFYSFCTQHGVFLIEDCSRVFGSQCGNQYVGNKSDFCFVRLGKATNISTYDGGILFVNSEYEKNINDVFFRHDIFEEKKYAFSHFIMYMMLDFLTQPQIYEKCKKYLDFLKDDTSYKDFIISGYSRFDKILLYSNLKNMSASFGDRIYSGQLLYSLLKQGRGVILPQIQKDFIVCSHLFPVVLKDNRKLVSLKTALENSGIEAVSLYQLRLDMLCVEFSEMQKYKEFKIAKLLAEGLLFLPINRYMSEQMIRMACSICNEIV